jgi:YidC/Oxa1 family membrane protein insertase
MSPLGQEPGTPDTTRLILTVVLCTAVYMTWVAFFAPTQDLSQPVGLEAPGMQNGAGVAGAPAAPSAHSIKSPDANERAAATQDQLPTRSHTMKIPVATQRIEDSQSEDRPEDRQSIRGGIVARLSNEGAQITQFILDGYDDVGQAAKGSEARPKINLARGSHDHTQLFALRSRGGNVQLSPRAKYEMKVVDDREVRFTRLTQEGLRIDRTYRFTEGEFGFSHEIKLHNESAQELHIAFDLVMVGQESGEDQVSSFGPSATMLNGVCRVGDEFETVPSGDLIEEETRLKGHISHAGLGWHYFLAAVIPTGATRTQGCLLQGFPPEAPTGSTGAPTEETALLGNGVQVSLQNKELRLAPGEKSEWSYKTFFGPKQLALLQAQGHELETNIDFGMFGILSRPILWMLVSLYDFAGNFGVAIILLTFLIKLLTFPLTQKSYVSMQQMKVLAPLMKELQKKYGHDRTVLGQKQMEMYKEKGINPMAGCFPMLVQMPIWFALYRTLWNSVELYQQPFFGWITDLSQPDVFPLFGFAFLPFVVGALMLGQTLLQPPPAEQPQMKYVMWGMPIVFTFFMLSMPSGLSLYMITNSVLTVIQQLYIKKKFSEAAPSEAAKS